MTEKHEAIVRYDCWCEQSEPEWKCPICGCAEREPFQLSHYPFGRGRSIIQTFDFSKTASCCKQCRLVFAIPLKEK